MQYDKVSLLNTVGQFLRLQVLVQHMCGNSWITCEMKKGISIPLGIFTGVKMAESMIWTCRKNVRREIVINRYNEEIDKCQDRGRSSNRLSNKILY